MFTAPFCSNLFAWRVKHRPRSRSLESRDLGARAGLKFWEGFPPEGKQGRRDSIFLILYIPESRKAQNFQNHCKHGMNVFKFAFELFTKSWNSSCGNLKTSQNGYENCYPVNQTPIWTFQIKAQMPFIEAQNHTECLQKLCPVIWRCFHVVFVSWQLWTM